MAEFDFLKFKKHQESVHVDSEIIVVKLLWLLVAGYVLESGFGVLLACMFKANENYDCWGNHAKRYRILYV